MSTENNHEKKSEDLHALLKECDSLPDLIHKKVGLSYSEQSGYFMKVEKLHADVKALVEKANAEFGATPEDPSVAKNFSKQSHDDRKPAASHQPINLRTEQLTNENAAAYAITWINEIWKSLEAFKLSYEQAKKQFNELFDDVKKCARFTMEREALMTLNRFQHPEQQRNKNFIHDIRAGGMERFLDMLNRFETFNIASQKVLNDDVGNARTSLTAYETLLNISNAAHMMSGKLFLQVLQNPDGEDEDGNVNTDKANAVMKLIELLGWQNSLMETYRYHFQKFNENTLNLVHFSLRIQNVLIRVQGIYMQMLKSTFMDAVKNKLS